MGARLDTVSFLSDYGTSDEFVGVVKSVVRSIAPHVTVLDITHDIRPYDVKGGSLTLARSAQYLCPGVVLAIVDPGVGTDRRGAAAARRGGGGLPGCARAGARPPAPRLGARAPRGRGGRHP